MGKIVKYCSSCDEGFAEKFGFCPDCGSPLQAFEMNPVTNEVVTEPQVAEAVPPTPEFIAGPIEEISADTREEAFDNGPADTEEVFLKNADVDDDDYEPQVIPFSEGDAVAAAANTESDSFDYLDPRDPVDYASPMVVTPSDDDGYHLTVIEEKNVAQRNGLLLAASVFMIVVVMSATVYSLFAKSLAVGAIDDGNSLAFLIDDVPMPLDEEEIKKEKDKGGGGGGGGREEKDPTSQGDLADQSKTPTRPPDAKVFRSDTFDLKMPPPQTEGDRKFPKQFNQWGDPNSRFGGLSNGTGCCAGQGSGNGSGQGSGNGTGTGSGNGSGSGSGDGTGNGSGSGPGGNLPPPPKAVGVTTNLQIIAKPKPTYTDAARQNNVQGTVRLRVTFLASGAIGSISPVQGLPNGLTEQAIAAARQIRFEPKKINGVPVAVTKSVDYAFSIY